MTKEYKDYLKSKEWATIRIELFTIRGKNCERCNSNKNLQIHHKTYKNIFNEEPGDLEILCGGCHEAEHKIKKKAKKYKSTKPFTFIKSKKKQKPKKKKHSKLIYGSGNKRIFDKHGKLIA